MRAVDSPDRRASASSQALATTKPGLASSEGCSETPKRLIQRRAPLISAPTTRTAIMPPIARSMSPSASRRTCRGPSKETTSITMPLTDAKTMCRSTKWNAGSPFLTAMAGLAASDMMRPAPINISKLTSSRRSIVNHHSAIRLSSVLVNLMIAASRAGRSHLAAPEPRRETDRRGVRSS